MTGQPAAKPFSPKMMIALVLVGVFAFSGFAVLSVYAPELRQGDDGGAHALSKSAIGYAGAVALLKARGTPVVVTRAVSPAAGNSPLLILTPGPEVTTEELQAYPLDGRVLIVLPKWQGLPSWKHPGWVMASPMLSDAESVVPAHIVVGGSKPHRRAGASKPQLHGTGRFFTTDTFLPLDKIDRLQTVSGDGWSPALVDEEGRMVLGASQKSGVWLLTDPDLINTQGLSRLDNARAALAIIDALRAPDAGVAFDVALNGFTRPRNPLRLILEPPFLGATLAVLAAALLMGTHAAVRFGPPIASARAFGFGKRALIDNSADLIRAARKEAELAPYYATLIEARTARDVGERDLDAKERLARLVRLEHRRKPKDSIEALATAASGVRTPAEALALAERLFHWRSEMTRDRG